jgi:hypothetical protein
MLIATAAGLPAAAPWRLSLPVAARWLPPLLAIADGPAQAPTPPPPR